MLASCKCEHSCGTIGGCLRLLEVLWRAADFEQQTLNESSKV